MQLKNHTWAILRLAFRWGRFRNIGADDISGEMGDEYAPSDLELVQQLREQLGLQEQPVSRQWRQQNASNVLRAYYSWIRHHESLNEKRYPLVPVMQVKSHFMTVRPALHLLQHARLLRISQLSLNGRVV